MLKKRYFAPVKICLCLEAETKHTIEFLALDSQLTLTKWVQNAIREKIERETDHRIEE